MEYVYYAYTLVTVVLLIYMLTKLRNPALYLIAGALITGFVIISQMALDDTKGYPVHQKSIDNEPFLVYSYRSGDWIYVWVRHSDDDEPRTYRIENTTQNKRSMSRAMSKLKKGVPIKVVKKTKKHQEYNESEYSFDEIIPKDLIPKSKD